MNKALYLVDTQSGRSLLLTKTYVSTGLPSFSPVNDELAAVIFPAGDSAIWILHGLKDYLERLYHPIHIEIFQRPHDAPCCSGQWACDAACSGTLPLTGFDR